LGPSRVSPPIGDSTGPDTIADGVVVDGRDPLPTHTTPTWEMELLVSGATTFGLLQLPPLLDRTFFRLINGANFDEAWLLRALWVYSKTALVTLILTFLLHLCLRGYWVALVGMDSVYPGGVRWANLRMGPIARRLSEARAPRMHAAIELADNRASRVFGTGFGFAMLMLIPVMIAVFGLAMTMLVQAVAPGVSTDRVFTIAVAILLLPAILASMADRNIGARLAEDGTGARVIRGVLWFYRRLGVGRRNNLLISLFVSHEGRAKMLLAAVLVLVPVFSIVMLPLLSQDQGMVFADHTLVADGASVHPGFYADAGMDRAIESPRPWIESRVASGPYLAVFVPYVPFHHIPAMRDACPEVLPASGRGAAASLGAPAPPATAAACLARLADLRVDGIAQDVPFDVSADPQTGQRGILAMVPMRGLAEGRHEISVAIIGAHADHPGGRYRIPFWK
jgi:hypothetical protein